jgi:general secretion pathway protein B
MSFILDALKKAEAERQRQSGPTLLEVRVSAPRRRFPPWTLVLGGLLAINMILLLLFALRKPAPSTSEAAPAATITPAAAAAAAPALVAAPPTAAPIAAPANAAVLPIVAPPAEPSTSVASPGATGTSGLSGNPADNQPAIAARGALGEREQQSLSAADLPNLSELGGDAPTLRLDLHVYAERPADRYALINMHKVHEGDVLPEGARVLQIYRDGVSLSYRGTEFMLRPQ